MAKGFARKAISKMEEKKWFVILSTGLILAVV
jgi:hypothetical protein